MIEAVLFALDDRLYPESQYRRSGLRHVAQVLGNPEHIFDMLEEFYRQTGDPIKQIVNLLLAEYHSHMPEISPYPDVVPVLRELSKEYRLGLVTSNTTGAQQIKIEKLEIASWFDHITIATHPHVKPTRRPYLDTLEALGVEARKAVFVGDDPDTDLLGAHRVGMKSILVVRKDADGIEPPFPLGSQPAAIIGSLSELPEVLVELSREAEVIA